MANPFVHIELHTSSVPKAKSFYAKLFDWKLSDVPDMGYTMLDAGKGGTGGGMMVKQMAEAPSQWLPYVEVASVTQTIAKAVKGGAQIIVPFMAIGAMGAIGVFVDPDGATLGVWERAKPVAKKSAAKKPAVKKATKPAAKKSAVKKATKPAAKKAGKKR
jgi:predicted enzyme related to lactoylglutathione lyase